MPTIDLTDAELAAATAAIRGVVETDKYPHAPRLVPLRTALARLEAETTFQIGTLPPAPKPKAPPPAKADKRARR
jgi:hypothetical protein